MLKLPASLELFVLLQRYVWNCGEKYLHVWKTVSSVEKNSNMKSIGIHVELRSDHVVRKVEQRFQPQKLVPASSLAQALMRKITCAGMEVKMVKLLQIEIIKYRLSKLIYTFLLYITLMLILLFLLGISTGGIYMFDTMETAIREANNALVWPGCIIIIGIWSNKILVQEYKDKTIQIVFTTGIERFKVMISKIVFIMIFSFIFVLLSTLILNFYLNNITDWTYYAEAAKEYTNIFSVENIMIKISVPAFMISLSGLIPAALGISKQSSSITYGVSIVLALLWSMQIGFAVPLLSTIEIRILLCLCGVMCSIFIIGICNKKDL